MSEAVKIKKSGNELKVIIIVLLGLILVSGAAFGGYYFAVRNNEAPSVQQTGRAVKEAFFIAIKDKVVNLADTDSKRYVKLTLTIAYNSENEKLAGELTSKLDVLEDAIIGLIRNKKAAELQGSKGAEELKNEVLARVNSLLDSGRATNIYYKDFLIQ
jgi:flagellar protein FliL